MGAKQGNRFNRTSNFTRPQFARLWNDFAWHKRLTATIRSASVS
ncbi:MAG: cellulase-like family protein [Limisphaerales bacterium]